MESLEYARLDTMMAQERARLAKEQAEAEAAIAADDRACILERCQCILRKTYAVNTVMPVRNMVTHV